MKMLRLAIIAAVFIFGSNSPAFSHGGGLDWQGGHNCRVGSCAGTYHCHQPRAGICAPKTSTTVKKSNTKTR
jgi:hypothetical protein